jgi:hypothetical protein
VLDLACHLLGDDLGALAPYAAAAGFAMTGDEEVLGTLLHTRAIIGTPKWA